MPYEKLEAWKACDALAKAVYQTTGGFPRSELYGLTSQLRRAAVSAAVNIAEGSALRGPRQFCRYLNISLGSLAEVSYLLQLTSDLGYLASPDYERASELRQRAGMLTWKLYRSLRVDARRCEERGR